MHESCSAHLDALLTGHLVHLQQTCSNRLRGWGASRRVRLAAKHAYLDSSPSAPSLLLARTFVLKNSGSAGLLPFSSLSNRRSKSGAIVAVGWPAAAIAAFPAASGAVLWQADSAERGAAAISSGRFCDVSGDDLHFVESAMRLQKKFQFTTKQPGWWCVLQLFRAPRGRIQPLSQMGQDLQAHVRKWLEGLPRKQGTQSLETITETGTFRNGNRTRDLWKSTRVLLPSPAV